MAITMVTRGAFMAVIALGLTACEEGLSVTKRAPDNGGQNVLPPDGTEILPAAAAQPADIPRGDIEAPDVFKKADKALWDGRPSLGGTWIAHTEVTEPQRVVIRNTENGKSTIAALFRREANNPGPAFQMSSDAAEKLGLLAGQPAVVEVVALKKPEKPKVEEAPVATSLAEETALEGAEGTTPAERAAAEGTDVKTDDSAEAIAADAAAVIGVTAAEGEAAVPVEGEEIAAVAPVKAGKPLPKPFVEIGYYSQEENAKTSVEQLTAEGLAPQVMTETINGAPGYRIIVGPASTKSELAEITERLKAMGFSAARAVKG